MLYTKSNLKGSIGNCHLAYSNVYSDAMKSRFRWSGNHPIVDKFLSAKATLQW